MIELKPSDFPQVTVCPPGRRSGAKVVKPSAKTYHVPGSYKRPRPDPTEPPSKVWYAVICNPNCEGRAQAGLDERVFRTYLPKRSRLVNGGGVKKGKAVVESALFPRYLFVASRTPAMPFFKLRGVDGIETVVRVDGQAIAIPHRFIAEIMIREEAGEFDGSTPWKKKTLKDLGYRKGQSVRVIDGPFDGFRAKIMAITSGKRAEVLIHMFSTETAVEMDWDQLEKLAASEKAA